MGTTEINVATERLLKARRKLLESIAAQAEAQVALDSATHTTAEDREEVERLESELLLAIQEAANPPPPAPAPVCDIPF